MLRGKIYTYTGQVKGRCFLSVESMHHLCFIIVFVFPVKLSWSKMNQEEKFQSFLLLLWSLHSVQTPQGEIKPVLFCKGPQVARRSSLEERWEARLIQSSKESQKRRLSVFPEETNIWNFPLLHERLEPSIDLFISYIYFPCEPTSPHWLVLSSSHIQLLGVPEMEGRTMPLGVGLEPNHDICETNT